MLPKVTHPVFETTLPISKQTIKFRSLIVKEEKLLLLAKETQDPATVVSNIRQVIINTTLDEIDVDKLSVVDIQWLFLQIRIQSIGSKVPCIVTDPEDKKEYEVEVDLHTSKITPEEVPSNIIKLDDNLGIKLHFPGIHDILTVAKMSETGNFSYELLLSCIDSVFDTEAEYNSFTKQELEEFVDSLSPAHIEKITSFFLAAPKMVFEYSYTTKDGKERRWEVDNFQDFFY